MALAGKAVNPSIPADERPGAVFLLLLLLFRAPTYIGGIGLPGDAHIGLCHVVKTGRPFLPLKEPATTAVLAGTLSAGGTPDLRRLGAEPRRWAILLAPLMLARRFTFDHLFFLGRDRLGHKRGKTDYAEHQDRDHEEPAVHLFTSSPGRLF